MRRTPWVRIRYQLGLGLLIAVLLPYLVRFWAMGEVREESLDYSFLGTTVALLGGYYGFRQLSIYPGVRASRYILPAFAISYGIVLAGFFMLRLDYSRLHFLSSFGLALLWYFFVYFRLRREKSLTVGILPFGDWDKLRDINGVNWVPLTTPERFTGAFDAIVADLRTELPDEWERFLADQALQGVLVMHVKQIQESLTGRVSIEHLSENNFGSLLPGILYARVKRLGDVIITLLALPVVIPVALAAAIVIRLDSPGPIFFRQQRMGYRGRPFQMIKFRTMTVAAGSGGCERESAITRDGDERITRVGRLFRQYRIDELPQIINVLRGEMSWIGPRPEAVPLSLWYEAELPFYRYRHIVRPGITGWAQVKQGHVAEVNEVLGKLHYDFYYIKNFSLWLDVLIVGATIRTILNGFGAR